MQLYKVRGPGIKMVREYVMNALELTTFWGRGCDMFKMELDKTTLSAKVEYLVYPLLDLRESIRNKIC